MDPQIENIIYKKGAATVNNSKNNSKNTSPTSQKTLYEIKKKDISKKNDHIMVDVSNEDH